MNSSSAETPGFVIVCVGRTNRSEFSDVLPSLAPWGTVLTAPTPRAARTQLTHESLTPDVIVVAQSYPGEFTDEQIDDLRRDAPLARVVAVLGTWCEGEMRSGTPWSGAVRVYWHQWKPHCHLEMQRLLAGRESLWNLPPTAGDEERCLTIAARTHQRGTGLVDIVTDQYDVFDLLAVACHDRGYEPRWQRTLDEPQADTPAIVLFDAAGDMAGELAKFRRLQVLRDASAIVLADFPRIADCNRFLQAGATAVLSRPFFWDDLFWYFPAGPA
jgi:hypothetical protein